MANRKRYTGNTNRNRSSGKSASSARTSRTVARRRRSASSDDMMVLKLLLLVVAVLVIFEGRLIFTMFTQQAGPIVTAVSDNGNDNIQTAAVEKTEEAAVSNDTAVETPPAEEAGKADTIEAPDAGADRVSSGSALAGFSAVEADAAAQAPAASSSSSSSENTGSSIYDENGYVISEHLDNDCVVPMQSVSVDDSYFSDAVFIGDSRMEGFHFTSGITQGDWLTSVGMTLTSISDSKVATPDGNITVYQGLSGRQYSKIYLMLGANDLGFWPWEEFLPTALSVLEQFHKLQPNALIYICSCIYVEESKVVTDYVNNANVIEVNKGLLEACEQLPYCWYVNLNEVLSNGWQALIQDASEDGVHLYEHYSKIMLGYLKNHYVSDNAAGSTAVSDASSSPAAETTEAGSDTAADDSASSDASDDTGAGADAGTSDDTGADTGADAPEPPPDNVNGIIIVN